MKKDDKAKGRDMYYNEVEARMQIARQQSHPKTKKEETRFEQKEDGEKLHNMKT